MVGMEILAGRRKQTLLVLADTIGQLLLAGGLAEISSGTAHIMDIAFKIGIPDQKPCLCKDGFVASDLDGSSLVEGKGAEAAAAKAASVADQGEFDL